MAETNNMQTTQKFYSRGIACGDVKNATRVNPARIIRYEFVARQYNAYVDDQERYREDFVSESPEHKVKSVRSN